MSNTTAIEFKSGDQRDRRQEEEPDHQPHFHQCQPAASPLPRAATSFTSTLATMSTTGNRPVAKTDTPATSNPPPRSSRFDGWSTRPCEYLKVGCSCTEASTVVYPNLFLNNSSLGRFSNSSYDFLHQFLERNQIEGNLCTTLTNPNQHFSLIPSKLDVYTLSKILTQKMFHRANFTTPSKEEEIAQDLITGIAILESGNHPPNGFGKRGKRPQDSPAVRSGDNEGSGEGNIKDRKAVHRDVERQRRREMANLFASMRSLLPLEHIKGKRSASDQMHEAVNYISHLKNNVKELEIKRDNLKKLSAGSSTTTATGTGSIRSSADNRHRSSSVTVSQCRGGMEVLINSCGFGEEGGLPLSKVFGVLTERGLNVVSYVSSEVNGRLFHAIRAEVSDLMYIDLFELEQKLSGVINGSISEQLQ